MDRLACVDVPALPLQLLLRREPEWASHPAVVVERDAPTALITWVNEHARALRILPGVRYATALGLTRELRAGVVDQAEIDDVVEELLAVARRFTPDIEPSREEPGVMWLDARGLGRLFRAVQPWAQALQDALEESGFRASIAVGFQRFASYALAKSGPHRIRAYRTFEDERQALAAVRLDRLGIDPVLRESLHRLGIETVGQFLELPAQGLFERFGEPAYRLHASASGKQWHPFEPLAPVEPLESGRELDAPDGDMQRLLFALKQSLDELLAKLEAGGQSVAQLTLMLKFERHGKPYRDSSFRNDPFRHDPDRSKLPIQDAAVQETIKPAKPTRDAKQLIDLLRLKLESMKFPADVIEMRLTVQATDSEGEQSTLLPLNSRRDPSAAARALARLRAEFGEHAVVRAKLADRHLPEGQYMWEPIDQLDDAPRPESVGGMPPLMRRIYGRPVPLPPKPHHLRDDGWLIHDTTQGAVTRLVGPYVTSGGWWVQSIHREYHFAETRRGDVLWVYFDRARRRWFMQGAVQ